MRMHGAGAGMVNTPLARRSGKRCRAAHNAVRQACQAPADACDETGKEDLAPNCEAASNCGNPAANIGSVGVDAEDISNPAGAASDEAMELGAIASGSVDCPKWRCMAASGGAMVAACADGNCTNGATQPMTRAPCPPGTEKAVLPEPLAPPSFMGAAAPGAKFMLPPAGKDMLPPPPATTAKLPLLPATGKVTDDTGKLPPQYGEAVDEYDALPPVDEDDSAVARIVKLLPSGIGAPHGIGAATETPPPGGRLCRALVAGVLFAELPGELGGHVAPCDKGASRTLPMPSAGVVPKVPPPLGGGAAPRTTAGPGLRARPGDDGAAVGPGDAAVAAAAAATAACVCAEPPLFVAFTNDNNRWYRCSCSASAEATDAFLLTGGPMLTDAVMTTVPAGAGAVWCAGCMRGADPDLDTQQPPATAAGGELQAPGVPGGGNGKGIGGTASTAAAAAAASADGGPQDEGLRTALLVALMEGDTVSPFDGPEPRCGIVCGGGATMALAVLPPVLSSE